MLISRFLVSFNLKILIPDFPKMEVKNIVTLLICQFLMEVEKFNKAIYHFILLLIIHFLNLKILVFKIVLNYLNS